MTREQFDAELKRHDFGRFAHVSTSSFAFAPSEWEYRKFDRPADPLTFAPHFPRAPEK